MERQSRDPDGPAASRPHPERQADLERVRSELEARLEAREERVGEITKEPERGSTIGFGKRVGDGTNEAVSRLSEVGIAAGLDASLSETARALAKLDEGSYALCDRCGAEIPEGRLAARPESELCLDCARA